MYSVKAKQGTKCKSTYTCTASAILGKCFCNLLLLVKTYERIFIFFNHISIYYHFLHLPNISGVFIKETKTMYSGLFSPRPYKKWSQMHSTERLYIIIKIRKSIYSTDKFALFIHDIAQFVSCVIPIPWYDLCGKH